MTHQSSRRRGAVSVHHDQSVRGAFEQRLAPEIAPCPEQPAADEGGRDFWTSLLREALASRSPEALEVAENGLRACPADPEMLLLAALTAVANKAPDRALRLLKRYGKRYVPGKHVALLTALAQAQQGAFANAWTTLQAEKLDTDRAALAWFVGDEVMEDWLIDRLREIRIERLRSQRSSSARPPPTLRSAPAQAPVRQAKPVRHRAYSVRSRSHESEGAANRSVEPGSGCQVGSAAAGGAFRHVAGAHRTRSNRDRGWRR